MNCKCQRCLVYMWLWKLDLLIMARNALCGSLSPLVLVMLHVIQCSWDWTEGVKAIYHERINELLRRREIPHLEVSIFSFLAGMSWPSEGSPDAVIDYQVALGAHAHNLLGIVILQRSSLPKYFRVLGAVICCPTTTPSTSLIWLGRRLPTTQVSCTLGPQFISSGVGSCQMS